jgi:uncharacterized protein YgiM (DUF1202 family)
MLNRKRASWLGVMLAVTITFAGCYPFQGDVSLLLTPVPVDPTRQAEILEAMTNAQAEAAATSESMAGDAEMADVTATVNANTLRVRQEASADSPIVAGLRQGDSVKVSGRSEDGTWLQVQIPDVETLGWVSAEFVTVEGDAMALPVPGEPAVAEEPAAVETPEPVAEAPAAVETPAPVEEAPASDDAMAMPALTLNVDPASLQIVDGVLTVPSITSSSAGWLVVHADDGGTFGPVIGYAALAEGENTDVAVEIDTEAATETVHLMLHEDGGVVGTYEFPGADAPVIADGAPVSMAYAVGAPVMSDMAAAPAAGGDTAAAPAAPAAGGEMSMAGFSLNSDPADLKIVDGTLTVPSITSASPGWMVVHADNEGKPGPVLGYAAVAEGENTDVVIPIDTDAATETVHLMLHEDGGVVGTYEFPGADAPVMVDGKPAMMAYAVGAPVMSDMAAAPAAGGEDAAAAPATGGDDAAAAPAAGGDNAAAAPAAGSESAMSAGDAAAMTGMSSSELATVNTRSARVRSGPAADAEVIGGALAGDIFPVAEKSADGNWVRIYFPGTDGEAWVGSELVDVSAVGLNVKYGNVTVNTDGPRLRVRNAPTLDGEIVGHVYNGDTRYAVGVSPDGKWALLFLPAMAGPTWVSAEYVTYQ